MRNLVWFRSDLRTEDNPALFHAVREASRGVVALFVACPDQWHDHDWGPPKADFVLRNVRQLSATLDTLGIALRFHVCATFDEVPEVVLEVARRHHCDAVFFNRELEPNERRRDRETATLLKDHGIRVREFDDQTALPPDAIRKRTGGYYCVFTPFFRSWARKILDDGPPEILPRPRRLAERLGKPSPIPRQIDGFTAHRRLAELWPAGEDEARRRLRTFLSERAGAYHERRDDVAAPMTSELSPYFAVGAISSRVVLGAALEANRGEPEGNDPGIAAWIRQLAWRDFFRHVLLGFPRVGRGEAFRREYEAVAWYQDHGAFEAWQQGFTGVPFVDAGQRQLRATGFMHNRARMISASFLVKDLLVEWRWGEQHFMQCLVDADFANNNGGWQWSASCGTDAAPYFRIFNPWKQGRRYDPEGRYIQRWVPELAGVDPECLHDPRLLDRIRPAGYPPPLVDHSQAARRAISTWRLAKGG